MSILTSVLLILLFLVLNLALISLIVIGVLQIYSRLISKVPLVPARKSALKIINQTLNMKDGDVLYDLGSGDGRVLASALEEYPNIKAIGLEIGPWPRLVSKLKLRKYGSRVKILNQDFFQAKLPGATHVFLYLYPTILQRLEPVFDKELASGTRVVSCDFKFPDRIPNQTVTIPQNKTLSKTLYVYTW